MAAAKRKTTRRRTYKRRTTARKSNPTRRNNPNPKPVIKMAQTAVLALVGGVLSGFLANQIPVEDTRIKAGIPIVGGLVLGVYAGRKMPMLQGVALGMVVMGGVSLVKQLAPQLPMLAGENYLAMPSPAYKDYMGKTVELGETVPFAGESGYEDMAYTSPAAI